MSNVTEMSGTQISNNNKRRSSKRKTMEPIGKFSSENINNFMNQSKK